MTAHKHHKGGPPKVDDTIEPIEHWKNVTVWDYYGRIRKARARLGATSSSYDLRRKALTDQITQALRSRDDRSVETVQKEAAYDVRVVERITQEEIELLCRDACYSRSAIHRWVQQPEEVRVVLLAEISGQIQSGNRISDFLRDPAKVALFLNSQGYSQRKYRDILGSPDTDSSALKDRFRKALLEQCDLPQELCLGQTAAAARAGQEHSTVSLTGVLSKPCPYDSSVRWRSICITPDLESSVNNIGAELSDEEFARFVELLVQSTSRRSVQCRSSVIAKVSPFLTSRG